MLQNLSTLRGSTVHAVDGDVGTVKDFYFDDERWTIRYVVIETGGWLKGRPVVVSVMSLLAPDWESGRLPARLTREQIRESPDLGSHPVLSRAMESQLLSYYGYPFYWAGDALWGHAVNPVEAAEQAAGPLPSPPGQEETRLHSCRDVIGYHIHARDGEMGHVDDLQIDPTAWAIEGLVIDTSNWLGGKALSIAPVSIGRVDWEARAVRVNLSRQTLEAAAESEAREKSRTKS